MVIISIRSRNIINSWIKIRCSVWSKTILNTSTTTKWRRMLNCSDEMMTLYTYNARCLTTMQLPYIIILLPITLCFLLLLLDFFSICCSNEGIKKGVTHHVLYSSNLIYGFISNYEFFLDNILQMYNESISYIRYDRFTRQIIHFHHSHLRSKTCFHLIKWNQKFSKNLTYAKNWLTSLKYVSIHILKFLSK